ncbi:hypothetical protein Val02_60240 [Virgisporangium aliadipatigenens]|uniref:Glycoside-hydrolase family GH114 TIM-barrel domain-containing protein n=1 Tax=Virgisporangium aliadipatigenens TaxID=741659 RepID=A0A8J4DTM0_9ACTN|nr:endo alpha-1,4 polygalactosaminidase [Virgisporangium aliadipatigenens]GIJ49138.1 hypothetical protein Val02_60240 [Virgisporangium aliadipatigenens]
MSTSLFRRHARALLVGAATATLAVAAVAFSGVPAADAAAISYPKPRAKFDYQIGGAYTPPSGVTVVSRDRGDDPAPGLYNICYVNGFQGQPGAANVEGTSAWFKATSERAALLLKRNNGQYFEDPEWPGEIMFDIRTDAKRRSLANIVGGWIARCAADGFQAVEIDNLDTFTRSFVSGSSGATYISEDNAKAYARLLTAAAHANGLAVAQKNTLELELDANGDLTQPNMGRELGFDFGIVEECGANTDSEYAECQLYKQVWGGAMFVIEYTRAGYNTACTALRGTASVIRRDVSVSPGGPYQFCG